MTENLIGPVKHGVTIYWDHIGDKIETNEGLRRTLDQISHLGLSAAAQGVIYST